MPRHLSSIAQKALLRPALIALACCPMACSPQQPEPPPPSFTDVIAPMLQTHCGKCHYGGRVTPNFLADYALESLMNGYVIPGNAQDSPIIHILKDKKHVSRDPLDPAQMKLLKHWINTGATAQTSPPFDA